MWIVGRCRRHSEGGKCAAQSARMEGVDGVVLWRGCMVSHCCWRRLLPLLRRRIGVRIVERKPALVAGGHYGVGTAGSRRGESRRQ